MRGKIEVGDFEAVKLVSLKIYFLCRRFAAVLRSKIEVGDFEAVKLVSLKFIFKLSSSRLADALIAGGGYALTAPIWVRDSLKPVVTASFRSQPY